jgi:hypothetical protein
MLVFPQLTTGALAQFPVRKLRQKRTVTNTLGDMTMVKLADPQGETTEWRLEYTGLSDAEVMNLQQFYLAAEGRLNIFTFLDPMANLFAWSDQLNNGAWTTDPFLALTGGITDAAGGSNAWTLSNSGGAPQTITQTINAPGGYTYTGFPIQLIAPADPNFDHANFYWRLEQQGESAVTVHSPTTVGNGNLEMAVNAYQGMVARITRGTAAGQERTVVGNDPTTVAVSPAWDIEPDATSFFVVAEAGWHFGAQTRSSPVQFAIPNHSGEVAEITGRSANANDVECASELSIVTRWQIGGSGLADSAAPPEPSFGMNAGRGGGTVELNGVSFTDLTNTRSISSGTLTLYYWNELQAFPALALASSIGTDDQTVVLNPPGSAETNSLIHVDGELMLVGAVSNNGSQYQVTRAASGSQAASHNSGALVYLLLRKTVTMPFPPEFFGSPYGGSWSYPLVLPDVRVASAELFVTNNRGNSPTSTMCLTGTTDNGLRTLSGGQYCIQVQGYLAVDQNAAPALVVDSSHSVRDVFAVMGKAADAPIQLQLNVNGATYCQLTIVPGQFVSNSVDGNSLPPLTAGAQITLSILAVGQTYPGSDLTVLIRL